MVSMPSDLKELLFDKSENEPLSDYEQELWQDWLVRLSGEYWTVDLNDPLALELIRVYIYAGQQKAAAWEKVLQRINIDRTVVVTEPEPRPQPEPPVIVINRRRRRIAAWVFLVAMVLSPVIIRYLSTGRSSGIKLTLANNATFDLEDLAIGFCGIVGNTQIWKKNDSLVEFTDVEAPTARNQFEQLNTFATPVKRKFYLRLSDGSLVVLNASSSLQFPLSFPGHERQIHLTGEAYFEVAKNSAKPFRVTSSRQTEVSVLGTVFNFRAYPDDSTEVATLVSGEVTVKHKDSSVMLQSNQQVIITADSMYRQDIKSDYITGLRQGYIINLEGETLQTIMNQVERLYGVPAIIKGNLQVNAPKGWIGKKELDLVLKDLNFIFKHLNFRLDEKTKMIIVNGKK